MGLCCVTFEALKKYLPARILSFGYPDHIEPLLEGSTLLSVDLFKHKGVETIADLNEPLGNLGTFDVVLDVGTTEHCSNPTQAFVNAAQACAVGGIVFHHLPMTMVNHGYWNICPAFLKDFYTGNGFAIVSCDMTAGEHVFDGQFIAPWPSDPYMPMDIPSGNMFMFVARKIVDRFIKLPYCESKWGKEA